MVEVDWLDLAALGLDFVAIYYAGVKRDYPKAVAIGFIAIGIELLGVLRDLQRQ